MKPPLIITIIWAIGAGTIMVLMGLEVIHNEKVVDRLLITIPGISAIIAGYWFSKKDDS